jgi:hypothetical protein
MAELKDLLVNRARMDEALLAELLSPFLGIDAERMEVVPMEGWVRLSIEGRVLAYLLARKAMASMEEVRLEVEAASPKDIEAATGVKGGTLRPKLVRMKASGLVSQDNARRYFVPTHAVVRIKPIIERSVEHE